MSISSCILCSDIIHRAGVSFHASGRVPGNYGPVAGSRIFGFKKLVLDQLSVPTVGYWGRILASLSASFSTLDTASPVPPPGLSFPVCTQRIAVFSLGCSLWIRQATGKDCL